MCVGHCALAVMKIACLRLGYRLQPANFQRHGWRARIPRLLRYRKGAPDDQPQHVGLIQRAKHL
jgi:hypothetical protein